MPRVSAAETFTGDDDGRRPGIEPRFSAACAGTVPIHVIARIRPLLSHEQNEDDVVTVQRDSSTVVLDFGPKRKKHFTVDEVFDSRLAEGTQEAFFVRAGRGLAKQSLEGMNVCIFAYGHTGSGKTYSMVGDTTAPTAARRPSVRGSAAGLIPRFIREVFAAHAAAPGECRYSCEFFEVYNEQIHDLLAAGPGRSQRRRAIHAHPKHGVRIEGLAAEVVTSTEETLEVLHFGNRARSVAATTMNERSSRSHAVFKLRFERSSLGDGEHLSSTVTFVDLAGQEEHASVANEETQFRERCYINTSLFHLAHVIGKLSENQVLQGSLADFRNSKLTLILSQAVTGNCRTALVATLAPGRSRIDDSASTLSFAQEVKKIQTRPVVNDKPSALVVVELEKELEQLRRALGDARADGEDKCRQLLAAQALIEQYKQSWEEAEAKSSVLKRSRSQGSGVSHGMCGQASPHGPTVLERPFLTKLCDDPSLQACANYFLTAGSLRIGSDEACDIVLGGVGIEAFMCVLTYVSGLVHVQLADHCARELVGDEDDEACGELWEGGEQRVLVGGLQLHGGKSVQMQHGDSLILGYSHAFRLVKPYELESIDSQDPTNAVSVARETLKSLDVESALSEVQNELCADFPAEHQYLGHLRARGVPHSDIRKFAGDLQKMRSFVEEANLLTRQVLPDYGVAFKLHLLASFSDCRHDLPRLVVCVVMGGGVSSRAGSMKLDESGCTGGVPQPRSQRHKTTNIVPKPRISLVRDHGLGSHMLTDDFEHLLYIWSLEKFLQRLGEMRDVYEQGEAERDGFVEARARLRSAPQLNPWRELALADVKLSLTRFAAQPAITHESIRDPASIASRPTSTYEQNKVLAPGRASKLSLKDLPAQLTAQDFTPECESSAASVVAAPPPFSSQQEVTLTGSRSSVTEWPLCDYLREAAVIVAQTSTSALVKAHSSPLSRGPTRLLEPVAFPPQAARPVSAGPKQMVEPKASVGLQRLPPRASPLLTSERLLRPAPTCSASISPLRGAIQPSDIIGASIRRSISTSSAGFQESAASWQTTSSGFMSTGNTCAPALGLPFNRVSIQRHATRTTSPPASLRGSFVKTSPLSKSSSHHGVRSLVRSPSHQVQPLVLPHQALLYSSAERATSPTHHGQPVISSQQVFLHDCVERATSPMHHGQPLVLLQKVLPDGGSERTAQSVASLSLQSARLAAPRRPTRSQVDTSSTALACERNGARVHFAASRGAGLSSGSNDGTDVTPTESPALILGAELGHLPTLLWRPASRVDMPEEATKAAGAGAAASIGSEGMQAMSAGGAALGGESTDARDAKALASTVRIWGEVEGLLQQLRTLDPRVRGGAASSQAGAGGASSLR